VYGGIWDGYKGYRGLDLLSGNWRANLRIGGSQAWIDNAYFIPAAPPAITPSSIVSSLVNLATNPYVLPAGAITINMSATMLNRTTYLGLRGNRYVVSEPWVMVQTYTVRNTGSTPLTGMAFYMYYFASPYGTYPVNPATCVSYADYTAGLPDPMGFTFDITLYGQGTAAKWAYTGLSTNVMPTAHDVGHGGGYPDPPYYTPTSSRPSANPTDVLRLVESDSLLNRASYNAPSGTDPNAVAGALKWYISILYPGDSWTITVLESVASPVTVGGIWVPVDKLSLLAPYIALVSTILVATSATAIYTKRRKKQ
jgi:hypothetical protein